MKKLLTSFVALAVVVAGVFSYASANGTSTSWQAANHNENLNFAASYQNGVVTMSWNQFTIPAGHSWTYWKVVRSTNKTNPVYPDDGYIKYDGNMGFTSYTDSNPPQGTVYYGICAIHSDSYGKYRDCDWQAVSVDGSSTSTTTTTTTTTTVSDAMKTAIDRIVEQKFMPKLEATYPSVDDQVTKLESLITAIDAVIASASSKNKPVFEYLKVAIQNQLDMKQIEALLDL